MGWKDFFFFFKLLCHGLKKYGGEKWISKRNHIGIVTNDRTQKSQHINLDIHPPHQTFTWQVKSPRRHLTRRKCLKYRVNQNLRDIWEKYRRNKRIQYHIDSMVVRFLTLSISVRGERFPWMRASIRNHPIEILLGSL